MADKFELSTRRWVPAPPQVHFPTEERQRMVAWDEMNRQARILRKIMKEHGRDAVPSILAGEAVVIVEVPEHLRATSEAVDEAET